MDHLYQKHFGLKQAPFNITPDPFFLYLSESHQEALAQLSYGIRARKGFIVLTGEVGTGKTTLIHSLLRDLGDTTRTALIFSMIQNPVDLLRYVCEEFQLIDLRQPCATIHDYLVLLNEFLLEKYRANENCALIIDEAQNLSSEVLESIRLLSNFETSTDKLLQIVLVGQPELAVRLNSQELRQLKQRICLRHHLRSLNLRECQEYVSKRLQTVGGDPSIFTQSAIESIYRYSNGIPRLINVIGDNALLTTFALEKSRVDDSVVREVANDLSLSMQAVETLEHPRMQRLNGAPSKSNESRTVASISPISSAKRQVATGSQPPISRHEDYVPPGFFDVLRVELTEAMGPMANIVIEDAVTTLGHMRNAFPEKSWKALIESVSREIFDPSIKQQFQRSLAQRLPEVPRPNGS